MNAEQMSFIQRCARILQAGRKPECPVVEPLVREYYAKPKNGAGGSLHIVLDDGNTEDSSVDFCVGWALEAKDWDGVALAAVLRKMSRTQREKLGRLS